MHMLICPNCESEMMKVEEPDITIDKCENCGGIFLDKGELNILATGMGGDIEFSSIDENIHTDKFGIRKCPKCSRQKMRKINLLYYSDLIFDYCPKCEGFFLDKGELENMNHELTAITKNISPEEYRGYQKDHLVRLDKITDDIATYIMGRASFSCLTFHLRLSVYFKKPLNAGLRMYLEKWTVKISKLLRLFKEQDIQTGFKDLDKMFIIQGKNMRRIKKLLSSRELRKMLLDIVSNNIQMNIPARLEITDDRIMLTEGPYIDSVNYDVEKDPSSAVAKLVKLAALFEETLSL